MNTNLSILLLFLTLLHTNSQLHHTEDPSTDYFCGIHWEESHTLCSLPCPSGLDTDCPQDEYGRRRRCYASAGCAARRESMVWYGVFSLAFDVGGGNETITEMSDAESGVFEDSMMGFIADALRDKVEVDCFEVLEQEYDRPCVGAVIEKRLSTMESTFLDLTVKICASYIPSIGATLLSPSDLENDILRIMKNQEQAAIKAVSSSSEFFTGVTGVHAISTEMMVEPPSSSPSEPPTRPSEQFIETYLDPLPSGSYGIFFNVKTHKGISTLTLNSMSFLTKHRGLVEYEVYSRLGEYRGYEGYVDEWDLIARGETLGNGPFEFTPVLNNATFDDEMGYIGFMPVHVPGNGGVRSFYITMTGKYMIEEDVVVPISFSNSLKPENDGKGIYGVVTSNEELEILEGDAVLDYPARRNRNWESDIYYRRPRGFIGKFEYTRNACYPTFDFFGWPCPYVPKPIPDEVPVKEAVTPNTHSETSQSTNTLNTNEKPEDINIEDVNPKESQTTTTTSTPEVFAGSAHYIKENDASNGAMSLAWQKRILLLHFLLIARFAV